MDFLCPWDPATYLIFSTNVPTLLYYSHLVAILAAVIFGLFLFGQRKGSLAVTLFFVNITFFTAWTVIDMLLWASNRGDLVLFYWSLQVLLEILIYATSFYFAYVFVTKKDLPFVPKLGIFALLAPALVLLATPYFLPGVDLSYCNAIESDLVIYYTYGFEILVTIIALFIGFRQVHREPARAKEIGYFLAGVITFLVAFSSGNIIGSLTEDWALAQIGLFGMPIFTGFLAYTVVRFKAFNVKLVGTQALVVTLWLLTLAILFIRKIENVRYVVAFTLILFTVLGYQLIRSVKREIEAREKLEIANARLKELDKQKTEFVSFATHQLRSPLAAMRGNASLILEGDYGKMDDGVKTAIQTILTSVKTLATVVEDYLNISRIELGTMKYTFVDMDFGTLVKEVVNEQKTNIEAKGLSWKLDIDESKMYKIKADPDKFKQVLMNTIDNSVKYTPTGSIAVSLEKDEAKKVIRFKVSDTGVGITPDVMPKLFQKFSRAAKANEANIHGTGLGLFIAKDIVNAHGGRIWAESEGEGKGSQFYVEMPEAK